MINRILLSIFIVNVISITSFACIHNPIPSEENINLLNIGLKDCSKKAIGSAERKIKKLCSCTQKNLDKLPANFQQSQDAKKDLIKTLKERSKIAYLNLLENISTLNRSYEPSTPPKLEGKAPNCAMYNYLPSDSKFSISKCKGKNPILNEDERVSFINDFFNKFRNEQIAREKKYSTTTAKDESFVNRSSPRLKHKCSSENSEIELTDEFIADMRDKSTPLLSDALLEFITNDSGQLKVDLNDVFQDQKERTQKKDRLKSVDDVSLADIITFSRKNFNGNNARDENIIFLLSRSPIFKDILSDPKHRKKILENLKSNPTNAISSYYEEIKNTDQYKEDILGKMNNQCDKINRMLEKTLCAETETPLLPNSPETVRDIKRVIKSSYPDDDHLSIYSTTAILNENYCSKALKSTEEDSLYTEINDNLTPDLSQELKNNSMFEQATKTNHISEYTNQADKICRFFSGTKTTKDGKNGLLTLGTPPNVADMNAIMEDECQGDFACEMMMRQTSLTLYGFDPQGDEKKFSVKDFLVEKYKKEALEELEKSKDSPKSTEEIEKIINQKASERTALLKPQDLMGAYSDYKDFLAGINTQTKTNTLQGQMFSSEPVKTGIPPTTYVGDLTPTDYKANRKRQNLTGGNTSSSGRSENNFTRVRNKLQDKSRQIASTLNNNKTTNFFNEVIKRARRKSPGKTLSPQDESEAVSTAINSIGRSDPAPSTDTRSEGEIFSDQDRNIANEIERDSFPERVDKITGGGGNPLSDPYFNEEMTEEERRQESFNRALGETFGAVQGMKNYEERQKKGKGLLTPGAASISTAKGPQGGDGGSGGSAALISSATGESDEHLNTVLANALKELADGNIPNENKVNLNAVTDFVLNLKPIVFVSHENPNHKVAVKRKSKSTREVVVETHGKDVNEADPQFVEFKESIQKSSFVKFNFDKFFNFFDNTEQSQNSGQLIDLRDASYDDLIDFFKAPKP